MAQLDRDGYRGAPSVVDVIRVGFSPYTATPLASELQEQEHGGAAPVVQAAAPAAEEDGEDEDA
jgi:hypothetical protein